MSCKLASLYGLAFLAVVMFALAGCSGETRTGTTRAQKTDKDAHEHPAEGPHHGALAEWGNEEYHAEFTVDHAQKQATVYILDGSGKKAAPIAAETITLVLKNVQPPATIPLKPQPQKDDPEGKSSRFVGEHEALAKEMEFEGEISGKVGDKPYTGEFKEKPHKDH